MDTKMMFRYLRKLPGKWFLAVIAFIWMLGAMLRAKWPNIIRFPESCIILTIIILAIWLPYLAVKLLRERKKAKEAVEEEVSIPGLEERLVRAAKSSKDVPWYLVIGPSGSGKTSMLRSSDLDFSYVDSLQEKPVALGIEKTKNCDLFFTEEAVILDTSGRYVDLCNEARVKGEFTWILSLLKELRKQNPIAGLMVSVDISRLLGASQEALEKEAKNIRYCIEEIISELQIKLPVYLVFTRCDSVHGFAQFFSALGSDERMQIWGSTLKTDQTAKPGVSFSEGCRQLVDVLMEDRKATLALAHKQDRNVVYRFPLEFEMVCQMLIPFVGSVFQSISEEKPVFRGFYFTSSVSGMPSPVSFLMQKVAKSLNLQPPSPQEQPPEGKEEPKGYFIRELFKKVIFSDRELYAPTGTAQRRNMFMRLGIGAAVFLVFLALTTVFAVSYARSKGAMGNAQRAAVQVRDDPRNDQDLEKFRASIVRLERPTLFWRKHKKRVADEARKVYLREKYGSDTGWEAELGRKVEVFVEVVKSKDGETSPIPDAEVEVQQILTTGKEGSAPDAKAKILTTDLTTDKKGSAVFRAKIEDGKARFRFSTKHEEEGYEPLRPKTCEFQPGEDDGSVKFTFSTSMRTVTVQCNDQSGKPISGVPVYIEEVGGAQKYGPETSNEQGAAEFSVDAPENAEYLVYCDDSETNFRTDEPHKKISIESGKSDYEVPMQVRRKVKIRVMALMKDGSGEVPGVFVSVGETELGVTGSDGEWSGTSDVIPDGGNVKAESRDQSLEIVGTPDVKKTPSEYVIMLEYAPATAKQVTTPEPEQEEKPKPPPYVQIVVDPQLKASEIEVWTYITDGETDGLKFVDEMDFESSGKKLKLGRLDAKVDSKGHLELPREVEGNRFLLYHPDYWPQDMEWQQMQEKIGMTSIDQERSFNDFVQEKIDGAEYFHKCAEEYYDDRKYEEAIENYNDAFRLAPRLRYYLRAGWAYYNNEQFDEAKKQIRRGLEFKLLDDPGADEKLIKQQLQELLDLLQ